ncbi:hypothetical protein D3C86_1524780 [compost metagenome]
MCKSAAMQAATYRPWAIAASAPPIRLASPDTRILHGPPVKPGPGAISARPSSAVLGFQLESSLCQSIARPAQCAISVAGTIPSCTTSRSQPSSTLRPAIDRLTDSTLSRPRARKSETPVRIVIPASFSLVSHPNPLARGASAAIFSDPKAAILSLSVSVRPIRLGRTPRRRN